MLTNLCKVKLFVYFLFCHSPWHILLVCKYQDWCRRQLLILYHLVKFFFSLNYAF